MKNIENNIQNWNILFVESGSEKKVIHYLKSHDIVYFAPYQSSDGPWWKLYKIKSYIFPSFIFLRTTNLNINQIKKIDGVKNLVYWLNQPAKVSNDDIMTIKFFLKTHKEIKIEKIAVSDDPVNNELSFLKRLDQSDSLTIDIPNIGYRLAARVATNNIRYLNSTFKTDKTQPIALAS